MTKRDMIVMRGRQEVVTLIDFGNAKLTGNQPVSTRTRTGMVIGTPTYMSPEQSDGKGAIDHLTEN